MNGYRYLPCAICGKDKMPIVYKDFTIYHRREYPTKGNICDTCVDEATIYQSSHPLSKEDVWFLIYYWDDQAIIVEI